MDGSPAGTRSSLSWMIESFSVVYMMPTSMVLALHAIMHSHSVEWLNWNSTIMVHLLLWDWIAFPWWWKWALGPSWMDCICASFVLTFRNDRPWHFVCGKGEASVPYLVNVPCLERSFCYNYCFRSEKFMGYLPIGYIAITMLIVANVDLRSGNFHFFEGFIFHILELWSEYR